MVQVPYNVQNRYDRLGGRMKGLNFDPAGSATYKRKDGSTLDDLVVSLGHTDTQEMIPGVAVTQVRYQDFIVDVADLDFGSGPVKPEYGDEICRGNGEVYKVVAMGGDNGSPFEYITSTKKRIRIHTEFLRNGG